MLEKFLIFSRAGVVLFSMCWSTVKGNPIHALVKDALLTQHAARGVSTFDFADYTLKWADSNSHSLVFAAVMDKAVAIQVKYAETLVDSAMNVFVQKYGAALDAQDPAAVWSEDGRIYDVFGFAPIFLRLLESAEAAVATGVKDSKRKPAHGVGRAEEEAQQLPAASASPAAAAPAAPNPASAAAVTDAAIDAALGGEDDDFAVSPADVAGTAGASPAAATVTDADIAAGRAALKLGAVRPGRGGGLAGRKPGSAKATPPSAKPSGRGGSGLTALPVGLDPTRRISEAEQKLLDRSKETAAAGAGVGGDEAAALGVERAEFRYDGSTGRDLDADDEELVAAATAAAVAAGAAGGATSAGAGSGGGGAKGSAAASVASWWQRSTLGTFLSSLTGNRVLERADLEPAMEQLKALLISKNVAREPAEALCASVTASLEGRRLEVAGSVAATVTAALSEAIERILTPRRPLDLLAEVRAKKEARAGPYVIVFVGVNGVGKSTTLSKVAYHLKDNRHSVLIAACDSFRAGAVEQLKRHCLALDVPLYHQGYSKDPVHIASAAIKEAAAAGTDVVLVDTAGRMQNNAPLMAALAKLVAVNRPDLVLFVGEALVGNDGCDQLSEFNKKLVEHAADRTNPRVIDGLVMTKFDTVDDKVGAALSMVYTTGIPVAFLGTGQKYTNLRKLNVGAVVKALLA